MFGKPMTLREKCLVHALFGLIVACCFQAALLHDLHVQDGFGAATTLSGQRAWMAVVASSFLWAGAAVKLGAVPISRSSRGVIETTCVLLAIVTYAFGPRLC